MADVGQLAESAMKVGMTVDEIRRSPSQQDQLARFAIGQAGAPIEYGVKPEIVGAIGAAQSELSDVVYAIQDEVEKTGNTIDFVLQGYSTVLESCDFDCIGTMAQDNTTAPADWVMGCGCMDKLEDLMAEQADLVENDMMFDLTNLAQTSTASSNWMVYSAIAVSSFALGGLSVYAMKGGKSAFSAEVTERLL